MTSPFDDPVQKRVQSRKNSLQGMFALRTYTAREVQKAVDFLLGGRVSELHNTASAFKDRLGYSVPRP